MSVVAVIVMASAGCVRDEVDLSNRPCPCAEGWRCDQSVNLCVRDVDGGIDADVEDEADVHEGIDVIDDGDIEMEADVEEDPLCDLPRQDGFNEYTVRAISDHTRYPRDGTSPFCHDLGCTTDCLCGETWGQIHDGWYGGQLLFDGGGDCYSSGFTMEIFLRAFQLFLVEAELPGTTLFRYNGAVLEAADLARDGGSFYRLWQGLELDRASSAAAFEDAGIGQVIARESWDDAIPGDFVNLWRTDDTGMAAIFASWVVEGGARVGIRYFGCCQALGESCFEQSEPENLSGPSFRTERFAGSGGTVLVDEVTVGRVFMPEGG